MSKTKIYSPNADYTGVIGGVAFAAGVGELDSEKIGDERFDHLKGWFDRKGYGVGKKSGAEDVEPQTLKGSVKPLSEMSHAELVEVAKGRGIMGASSMKKNVLIEAIEETEEDVPNA